MIINNIPIDFSEQREIIFDVAQLPTHTKVNLPVYIYRGEEPGPTLLLTASLHGNELNGIEIIRSMTEDKTIIPKIGTVISMPIVNIFGFLQQSRELPDGKDLNRSFPGNEHGSLAQRIAHTIIHNILPHVDYGIDFHTGATHRSNYPQIRCLFSDTSSMKLAHAFAPPFILNAKLRPKSFRAVASQHKKTIIVYEGGQGLRFNTKAIQEGVNGTLRVMHSLRMRSSSPPASAEPQRLQKTTWVRAHQAGLFRTFVPNGRKVKKREILATITDPFGDFSVTIKSPVNGYVIGVNHMPVVNRGDALLHLGVLNT